jgi:DNA-binding NtrC family response regulator
MHAAAIGICARHRACWVLFGGNRSRAAHLLGMTRRQFTYRMEKLGLADSVEPVWRQTL